MNMNEDTYFIILSVISQSVIHTKIASPFVVSTPAPALITQVLIKGQDQATQLWRDSLNSRYEINLCPLDCHRGR